MSGFSDALVLVAPVRWWPSLLDLSAHPLDPVRSFCAAAADGEGAHESVSSSSSSPNVPTAAAASKGKSEGSSSYGLSRLGRSLFMGAVWLDCEETADSLVEVWNPFSGTTMTLAVVQYPPDEDGEGGVSLSQLAKANRIRLRPTRLADTAKKSVGKKKKAAAPPPGVEAACLDLLLQRYREAILDGCLTFLRKRQEQQRSAGRVHTVMVSGEPCSGKRSLLEHVGRAIPPTLSVPAVGHRSTGKGPQPQQHHTATTTYVLEHRHVNFADLLAMDEREAVQVVRAVLRPIPHEAQVHRGIQKKQSTVNSVRAAVVVHLDHVDLLWQNTSGNALTDIVACQLCASLDALTEGGDDVNEYGGGGEGGEEGGSWNPTVFFLWSTAVQPSALAHALRQRLAAQPVHLTTPNAGERAACIELKFSAGAAAGQFTPTPEEDKKERALWVERLVDRTAHLSVRQLASFPVGTEGPQPRLAGTAAGAADTATVHAAYAHLFGLDTQVRRLEELVVWPLTHLRLLRAFCVPCAKGVLVCGPSGSGKTALLTALAGRLRSGCDSRGVHVMLVDGLSLIEKEVGRSEKNIAQLFAAARAQAPTALFLDNLDALAPPRGRVTSETTTATDRTLSTLLTEMDGVSGDPDRIVVVVASAPDPQGLDAAVRRPGRLDVHLQLACPPPELRAHVLQKRLSDFLRQVLAVYGANPENATTGERLAELAASVLSPLATEAAQRAGSAAETVAIVREVILSTLAALSMHYGAAGAQAAAAATNWPAFRTAVAAALQGSFAQARSV